MKTPKQKAKKIIETYLDCENYKNLNLDLFCDECGMSLDAAKICSLIAVDEILKAIPNEYLDCWQGESQMVLNEDVDYWQEVKSEILKFKY
jgi:hypothetical protein